MRRRYTVAQIAAEFGVTRATIHRHLDRTTQPQPRTGRPLAAASIARRLPALAGFYDYRGVRDAQVLTHTPWPRSAALGCPTNPPPSA